MTIKVSPEVWIEERTDALTSSYIYSCGNGRGIDILDGMKFTWGRSDYLAHPDPGTLQFTMKDPSTYWIQRMRDGQVIGKMVTINTKNDGGFSEWFMFRGRISGITIEPGPKHPKTGVPRFYLIHLTCADKLGDLGNIKFPAGTVFPAETSLNRAIRIKNACLSVSGIGDFFFNPGTVTWPMGPEDVSGRTALDVVRQFYGSFGDTMSYVASENNVRNMRRKRRDTVYLFQKGPTGGPEDHILVPAAQGYTQTAETSPDVNTPYKGMPLSGGVVTGDTDILTINPNADINRVEVTYPDSTVSYADVTYSLSNGDPDLAGRRLITNDSMITQTSYITTQTAPYILDRATQEGAAPQHSLIMYDTKATGYGFDSIRGARLLVEASERMTQFFLYGSPWTVMNESLPPSMGLIGGTMIYTGEGGLAKRWKFYLTLQTSGLDATVGGSIAWSSLDTKVKWGDYDAPGSPHGANDYYVDTPMTWADVRFLNSGSLQAYPTSYP